MKKAQEWANEIRYGNNPGGIDKTIIQIQYDALREGLLSAARMLESLPKQVDSNTAKEIILSAANLLD